jgi:hypothetical protein
MRIARGLEVDDVGDGGARVVSCDWPRATWLAAPLFAAGVPLAVWSVRNAKWVELGGALVFCAFGALCVALTMAQRRDIELYVGLDGVSLAGFRGAGPFARMVAQDLAAPVRLEIRPLGAPEGAPELPHAGGDLVLASPDSEVRLARRIGPGWRKTLESARDAVAERIPDLR